MRFRTLNWALAIGLTTAVAGCNRQEAPDTATQTPPQAQQPANPQQTDASLTTAVQAKYYGADDVRGHDIRVVSDGGVVTLNGTVESEAARQRAVSLAREVPGVTRVEDQLRVQTASAETGTATPAPSTIVLP